MITNVLVLLIVCLVPFLFYCMSSTKMALLILYVLFKYNRLTCFELFYSHTLTNACYSIYIMIYLSYYYCFLRTYLYSYCMYICVVASMSMLTIPISKWDLPPNDPWNVNKINKIK